MLSIVIPANFLKEYIMNLFTYRHVCYWFYLTHYLTNSLSLGVNGVSSFQYDEWYDEHTCGSIFPEGPKNLLRINLSQLILLLFFASFMVTIDT